jgi:hypothetical protein
MTTCFVFLYLSLMCFFFPKGRKYIMKNNLYDNREWRVI